MPFDENQLQNPSPEEIPLPSSPQEPTEPASENTGISEPSTMPPGAPEGPGNSESAIPVNNGNGAINQPEAIRPESESSSETPENEAPSDSKPATTQTPVNEPFEEQENSRNEQVKPVNMNSLARQLLIKARNAIQFRKRKKLDKIMSLFDKKKNGSISSPQVTNDEVEKLLHVSDATATRYLSQLEQEGKIKQSVKTGKGVSYSRI